MEQEAESVKAPMWPPRPGARGTAVKTLRGRGTGPRLARPFLAVHGPLSPPLLPAAISARFSATSADCLPAYLSGSAFSRIAYGEPSSLFLGARACSASYDVRRAENGYARDANGPEEDYSLPRRRGPTGFCGRRSPGGRSRQSVGINDTRGGPSRARRRSGPSDQSCARPVRPRSIASGARAARPHGELSWPRARSTAAGSSGHTCGPAHAFRLLVVIIGVRSGTRDVRPFGSLGRRGAPATSGHSCKDAGHQGASPPPV